MDWLRLPATAGTAAALLAAATIVLPYLTIDAGGASIASYYDFGPLTAVTVLMIALVTAVVFASGRQGRADPATAAGTALGLGLVATLLATSWALAVPEDFVFQLTTAAWFEYHRWAVVGSTAAMTICGIWYAYVLNLL